MLERVAVEVEKLGHEKTKAVVTSVEKAKMFLLKSEEALESIEHFKYPGSNYKG